MDWNFTLANYGPVWAFMVQLGLLLIAMLIGNLLRRCIPLFRKCLIPSALLGGAVLLGADLLCKRYLNYELVDNQTMQVVTYHALAIGFAAMSLKTEKTAKSQKSQVMEFGAYQGGMYMLQACVGLLITIGMFVATYYFKVNGESIVSYICGLILPLAFGQGPGNALTWDINYTNTPEAMFTGNGSFGLSLASIGFVVASVFGVLYINIFKKRGIERGGIAVRTGSEVQQEETEEEIPDNESVDKFSIQMGFVALAYAFAFGFMCLLANLSEFTNKIGWGFNFLWAAIAAMGIKAVVNFLRRKKVMSRGYINNYQMDRISGFTFDLMIVAGVAAIEINDVKRYIVPIVVLSVIGCIITHIYTRKVAKACFKGFEHEFFLMSFGTMTGTASNGMILMKE
ncbi:MAG: hypothetical protein E7559_01185, partial [Ruminococcaceae bacterium]|nr:hypothetical protein [Oscillospiraceae bacterium]